MEKEKKQIIESIEKIYKDVCYLDALESEQMAVEFKINDIVEPAQSDKDPYVDRELKKEKEKIKKKYGSYLGLLEEIESELKKEIVAQKQKINNSDDYIPNAYKRVEILDCFYEYIMNKRADNLKEAINLWESEKENANANQSCDEQMHEEEIRKVESKYRHRHEEINTYDAENKMDKVVGKASEVTSKTFKLVGNIIRYGLIIMLFISMLYSINSDNEVILPMLMVIGILGNKGCIARSFGMMPMTSDEEQINRIFLYGRDVNNKIELGKFMIIIARLIFWEWIVGLWKLIELVIKGIKGLIKKHITKDATKNIIN